jgi:early secretory antigenic target protein ESAT-6
MTSSEHMKVGFNAIETAASDTASTVQSLNQQLDELKGYLRPLVSTWQGQAALEYQQLQNKWDTSAADLNQVLQQISTALRTSHDNYQSTEQAAVQTFSGH